MDEMYFVQNPIIIKNANKEEELLGRESISLGRTRNDINLMFVRFRGGEGYPPSKSYVSQKRAKILNVQSIITFARENAIDSSR